MNRVRPRAGFDLAWRGELGADAVRTRRHLEPVLEFLDELDVSPDATSLPSPPKWSPITPDLLERVRSGLWDL